MREEYADSPRSGGGGIQRMLGMVVVINCRRSRKDTRNIGSDELAQEYYREY